jgi:hypothetical protein
MAGLPDKGEEMKRRSFLEKLRISVAMQEESKSFKKGRLIRISKKPVNQGKKN